MPRKIEAQVSPTSKNRICCFCGSNDDKELEYGKFYEYDGIVTHYYCLLLSSNMQQKGRDDQGILGFLPDDINKELRRGKRLTCRYCKKTGATLGCCNTKCKIVFHFPCGLKAGSLHQFFGEFRSYCKSHRPKQKIDDRIYAELKNSDDPICYICYDAVNPRDQNATLWAPCCKKNAWFHRVCVQRLAMSAGYFFKCPLCNNKTDFQRAMLNQGIFIPSQDASWELVPNAFEELLYRHNRCDANDCLCPKGREHTSTNAKWELTLCRTCGSQGIHMACGQLKWIRPVWECNECIAILNKTTTNDSDSSRNVRATNDLDESRGNVNLENDEDGSDSDVSVGTETTLASTSESSSSKTRENDESKTTDESTAVRITRRSVIPIAGSPETTKISSSTNSSNNDGHSPRPKRPRYSEPIVRGRNESVDSDDDVVMIAEPLKIDNSTTNDHKMPLQPLIVDNPRTHNADVHHRRTNDPKEPQDSKNHRLNYNSSHDVTTNARRISTGRSSTETAYNVVEIDLSESECAISGPTSDKSIDDGVTTEQNVPDTSELNIIITNVTSLAPEAFENVEDEKIGVKDEFTCLSGIRDYDDANGGMTSQNPIVLDDEPVPPIDRVDPTKNNNNNRSSINGLHDHMKIVRFDSVTSDVAGNPTSAVLYGITIPGTNQTIPLIFAPAENSNANAAIDSAIDRAMENSENHRLTINDNNTNKISNNRTILQPEITSLSPKSTKKSSTMEISSLKAPMRDVERPIAPRPISNVDRTKITDNQRIKPIATRPSLSLSVPLKAIVNEKFSYGPAIRKSTNTSDVKKISNVNQASSIKSRELTIGTKTTKSNMQTTSITNNCDGMTKPYGSSISSSNSSVVRSHSSTTKNRIATFSESQKMSAIDNSQFHKNTTNAIDTTTMPKNCLSERRKNVVDSTKKIVSPNGNVTSTINDATMLKRNNGKTIDRSYDDSRASMTINGHDDFAMDVARTNIDDSSRSELRTFSDEITNVVETPFRRVVRTVRNDSSSDDCDGDAGSDPAVQLSTVNSPSKLVSTRDRQATTNVDERGAKLEAGRRTVQRTSFDDAESDGDSDIPTDCSTSPDRIDASDRIGLIHKSINLRDLKFSIRDSDVVKMTLYETYTVNIKLKSTKSHENTEPTSLENRTSVSMDREAQIRNLSSIDTEKISNTLNRPSGVIGNGNPSTTKQSQTITREDVDSFAPSTRTSESIGIDAASRGQDELKENLDPIPIIANSNRTSTIVGDRKTKPRSRTSVNNSMRSPHDATEIESQQLSFPNCADTETREFVGSSGQRERKSSSSHEQSFASRMVLDRSVENLVETSLSRVYKNNEAAGENSNLTIDASTRKRLASRNEDSRDSTCPTTPKRSKDRDRTNVDRPIDNAPNSKHEKISTNEVLRSTTSLANSATDVRENDANGGTFECKVSIDLKRIRDVLAAKLNSFKKIVGIDIERRSVASVGNEIDRRDVSQLTSDATLFESRNFDESRFDRGRVASECALRRSKSLENLREASSRGCVCDNAEDETRMCEIKRRSFEEHDCVR